MIVGAGPTGLAAGNLLGSAGIATLIVERNAGLSNIPKAIALDDEGLRICQAMGLSTAVSNCIVSDIAIHCVFEGRLLAKVVPKSRRNGYPLISTFYQPEFETVLLDGLQRFSCINIRFQHTVEALEQSAGCVIVSIRTPTGILSKVQCAYLLACDGGSSIIRHSLNIPLQGMTFAQKWLVIDTISSAPIRPAIQPDATLAATYGQAGRKEEGDSSAPAAVKIFCNPQRPAVSIPAPHNGRRWEFMLLPGEIEKEMLVPATISALLQKTGASLYTQSIRQAVYTFHATQAEIFSQGRVFLLGDAAHMMPPFGGQGLNSGLRDAQNLVWKVAMVLQDRAAPQLLATYSSERSRHVAQMVAFTSFLGAIFMSTARPLVFCRNLLIQMLFALPIVREYLMEMPMKPQARYEAGFFIGERAGKSLGDSARDVVAPLADARWHVFKGQRRRMVGSLLPQPEVVTREGQRVLLDEVLGTGFALLCRHSNPEEAFATLKTDFWEQLGARFVCIQTDDEQSSRKWTGTKSSLNHAACSCPACQRRCASSKEVWGTSAEHSGRKEGNIARSRLELHDQAECKENEQTEPRIPIVVVRSIDKDFLRMSRDHFIVVRPDRFILGIFKKENADLFVSAFQFLLHRRHG